jgi:S-DNA-T family DNA segregation ATPase FtsK/SpoIIIE
MDVRICFRVRERKDVDLILGQGMLSSGWQAHKLNAPGKFLISAPEHDTPRRARAYLLTDEAVATITSQHAELRPELDEVSMHALDEREDTNPQVLREIRGHNRVDARQSADDMGRDPESLLWAALSMAADKGISVPDLMSATRMSRPWIYQRLREMADRGQVAQAARGRWRAVTEHPQ